MKIIIYRYNSICEPDYIEAFSKLGITVVEDTDGMDQDMDITTRLERLGNMIVENAPMFIFSINFFPFLSKVCDRLGIIYMSETVDCPVFEVYHKDIRNKCNRIFMFDKKQFLSIKNENPDGIFYLPLGAPAERVTSLLGNTDNYLYDISFVGSTYREKDTFLELDLQEDEKAELNRLVDEQIEDAGYGLDYLETSFTDRHVDIIKKAAKKFGFIDQTVIDMDRFVAINDYMAFHLAHVERIKVLNYLARENQSGAVNLFTRSDVDELDSCIVNRGGVRSLTEMPFVFRQSRINLNITMRAIQTGIPQRIWDVLACRGFLITNYQPELDEYFQDGVHLAYYRNIQELQNKISYYLANPDEAERIAYDGYNLVASKHTILLRVVEMIKRIAY